MSTDGGYESGKLGESRPGKEIDPERAKRIWKKRKQDRERKVEKRVHRDVVEGRFWRDQRKVVGWERKAAVLEAFVKMGFVMI